MGVDGKGERGAEGRSCMGFNNKVNVGICGMDVASGVIRRRVLTGCECRHLANSTRDSVVKGALRFCTRRMFLGGEGQLRDKRS